MQASEHIIERVREARAPWAASDNIAAFLEAGDLDTIEREVEAHIVAMMRALIIDADHNTRDTAQRMARMYVRELFKGRYLPRPCMTDFPNVRKIDELYAVGPVPVRSTCSHHLAPVSGHAWVGVIPGDRIIGLSKFSRITDWVMSRPQIQEEAAMQLADEIEACIAPKGLGVLIRATHACVSTRGVRDHDTTLTTSIMRGELIEHAARDEFLALARAQGF
jgi:GTP cyclohydrolase IA